MTSLTDQWLRTEFQDHARTIDIPADLHQESLRRARASRKRRKGLQAALTVGLAAAVTGVIVIVAGALSPSTMPTPARPAPATWTFNLFFVDMPPVESDKRPTLFAESVTVPTTGDKPRDVVTALLSTSRTYEKRGVNGFNLFFEQPIAQVNAVTVGAEAITVDLDREVWDPYPNVDCNCPPGDIVMQQLVWTLDRALDSTLPVLLTVNGDPARGIWFHRLDGPVTMEIPGATEQAQYDPPGIKSEVDPPAPAIQFATTNAWTGWYRGDYLAVYAGDDGYDDPQTGKVMVFTYDDDRTSRLGYTRTIQGSGALKVVAVDKPIIELQGQDGRTYALHLDSRDIGAL